jgi:carotenoid cleavage dioxygenase-like enzyme
MPETITQITRITFDLSKPDAEAVTLEPCQGALGDMPKIDDRFAMERYRIGYFALRDFPQMGIGQIDWDTGEVKVHIAGCRFPGAGVRTAHPDAPEGDGYLLVAVDRFAEKRMDLLVLDGNDVSRPPVATIKLPFPQPMCFHGCWVPA